MFFTTTDEIDTQVLWILLPGLSEGYYSEMLLRASGQIIRPVVKINEHPNAAIRGRFAKLAVCVNLKKPLISKIRINGKIQRVEYDSIPNVCFTCKLYTHSSGLCMGGNKTREENVSKQSEPIVEKSKL